VGLRLTLGFLTIDELMGEGRRITYIAMMKRNEDEGERRN